LRFGDRDRQGGGVAPTAWIERVAYANDGLAVAAVVIAVAVIAGIPPIMAVVAAIIGMAAIVAQYGS
jgi:hypothetical protein